MKFEARYVIYGYKEIEAEDMDDAYEKLHETEDEDIINGLDLVNGFELTGIEQIEDK